MRECDRGPVADCDVAVDDAGNNTGDIAGAGGRAAGVVGSNGVIGSAAGGG
jgi:hypothetical protein